MKPYVAMCSLSLLVGAALGHFNGKYSAVSHFVETCESVSVVVLQDQIADFSRHFHCFEILPAEYQETPVKEQQQTLPMI